MDRSITLPMGTGTGMDRPRWATQPSSLSFSLPSIIQQSEFVEEIDLTQPLRRSKTVLPPSRRGNRQASILDTGLLHPYILAKLATPGLITPLTSSASAPQPPLGLPSAQKAVLPFPITQQDYDFALVLPEARDDIVLSEKRRLENLLQLQQGKVEMIDLDEWEGERKRRRSIRREEARKRMSTQVRVRVEVVDLSCGDGDEDGGAGKESKAYTGKLGERGAGAGAERGVKEELEEVKGTVGGEKEVGEGDADGDPVTTESFTDDANAPPFETLALTQTQTQTQTHTSTQASDDTAQQPAIAAYAIPLSLSRTGSQATTTSSFGVYTIDAASDSDDDSDQAGPYEDDASGDVDVYDRKQGVRGGTDPSCTGSDVSICITSPTPETEPEPSKTATIAQSIGDIDLRPNPEGADSRATAAMAMEKGRETGTEGEVPSPPLPLLCEKKLLALEALDTASVLVPVPVSDADDR